MGREKVPGDFIEYGIALGGSAIYIASELDGDRHFHGYDVFGMIPSPTEQDDENPRPVTRPSGRDDPQALAVTPITGIKATYSIR
ncbi:hypothetical protein [Mesorhizobium sp. M0701]|uniref:TylF/MycF/NovP-related O-methyltransferase n=1 Tax=Mesorhizobium sp. M0701 TaxID=2956989 RepID=UPI00333760F4